MPLYRITTRSTKSLSLQKILTKKISKYLLIHRFNPNVGKRAYNEENSTLAFNIFNIMLFFFFWQNPSFIKVNSLKHVCPRRNHWFIFDKNGLKLF